MALINANRGGASSNESLVTLSGQHGETTVSNSFVSGFMYGTIQPGPYTSITVTGPATRANFYLVEYKDGTFDNVNSDLPANPIDASNIKFMTFGTSIAGNYTITLS